MKETKCIMHCVYGENEWKCIGCELLIECCISVTPLLQYPCSSIVE